jgi:hypothetical protein
MATKLEPIEISAHPEGAIVSIRAVVQLPSGPIPSPEEFRENCQAGTDQLLQAIPKLIPALFHWLSQLESESLKLGHHQDGQLENHWPACHLPLLLWSGQISHSRRPVLFRHFFRSVDPSLQPA